MFFMIAKIFWSLFQPLTVLALWIMIGICFFKFRFGRLFLISGCSLFLALGVLPVGQNLLVYLENTFVSSRMLPSDIDGIIVLGGSMDTGLSFAHEQVQLNENAERITEMIRLSYIYPKAKIVFTGGDGSQGQTSGKESIVLRSLLNNLEYDTSRIIFESESRDTFENYLFSKRLVHPQAGEKWLLVSSAFHLPRASAVFSSNGWNVIPYPAGFLTKGQYSLMPNLDVLGNYYKLQVAVREIVGIIAYTLTERIKPDASDVQDVDD